MGNEIVILREGVGYFLGPGKVTGANFVLFENASRYKDVVIKLNWDRHCIQVESGFRIVLLHILRQKESIKIIFVLFLVSVRVKVYLFIEVLNASFDTQWIHRNILLTICGILSQNINLFNWIVWLLKSLAPDHAACCLFSTVYSN